MDTARDEDLHQYGWAPGGYINDCRGCAALFTGANGAFRCRDCAVEHADQPAPAPAPRENPKTAAGLRKLPLDLIPPIALVEMAAVLGLGADCPAKAYGRWNWRGAPVEAETYVAAIERHLLRWRCGEEIDDQTGVSNLASAMCSLAILRDAQDAGTLIDNRRGSLAVLAVMDRYDASSMPVVKAA